MVFDLPMVWFLLPPPGDHRLMRGTTRQVDELYMWLMGRPEQLEPLYERLRQHGIDDPSVAEEVVERLTGAPSATRRWSYKERRKEMLLALLHEHADAFDTAIDELGRMVDHLRQTGLRGFVAEKTWDDDFTYVGGPVEDLSAPEDETAQGGTADKTTRGGTAKRAPKKASGRRAGGGRA